MIGKKWICLERYTFHTQNEVCLKKARVAPGHGVVLESERSHGRNTCHRQSVRGPSQKVRGPEIWGG